MIVGTCELELIVYDAISLKDKRQVIKSIIGKIQSRYNVSIAEIGNNDKWQRTIIGFACVTNDTKHANSIISNILKFIERDSRVEIFNHDIDIS